MFDHLHFQQNQKKRQFQYLQILLAYFLNTKFGHLEFVIISSQQSNKNFKNVRDYFFVRENFHVFGFGNLESFD